MSIQPKILYVEDDADDAMVFQLAVRKLTSAFYIVHCVDEAVRYIEGTGRFADRSHYPFPEVVFLDWRLAGRSGKDFLEWCRKLPLCQSLSVVVVSGSGSPHDVTEALAAGAKLIIPKQASVERFAACIAEALTRIARQQPHD